MIVSAGTRRDVKAECLDKMEIDIKVVDEIKSDLFVSGFDLDRKLHLPCWLGSVPA